MGYLGEIFAILTAVCWAITSTAFEHAGKKMGSLTLNIIRLLLAVFYHKERLHYKEVLGAFIAILGVGMMFYI